MRRRWYGKCPGTAQGTFPALALYSLRKTYAYLSSIPAFAMPYGQNYWHAGNSTSGKARHVSYLLTFRLLLYSQCP